jgi:hypothetical protein
VIEALGLPTLQSLIFLSLALSLSIFSFKIAAKETPFTLKSTDLSLALE